MRRPMVRPLLHTAAFLAMGLLARPAQADVAAANCPQTDPAAVVQTLNRLYSAAGAHDADGLRSVISSDFAAQAGGEKVDGETVIQRLVGAPPEGSATLPAAPAGASEAAPVALAISDPDVHILCDSAWATFRAPVAAGGAHAQSAVLNYQGDGWRVRFLNASVPPAADAPSPRTQGSGHRGGKAAGPGRANTSRAHGKSKSRSKGSQHSPRAAGHPPKHPAKPAS